MPRAKYQINLTEAAEKDLAGIIEYIARENPAAALKTAIKIEKGVLKLE